MQVSALLSALEPETAPDGQAKTTTARKIVTLALLGVVGGTVIAGAALPVSSTAGVAAKLASESFENLPSALQTPPTAQKSLLYANDGTTLIAEFWEENRTDVSSADIATVMKEAMVAAEDVRFYEHGGVDIKGLVRAFVSNTQGGEVSGASTLTMQYVRNVLKNDPTVTTEERKAATEQTTGRKLQEIRFAISIDDELEKDEILRRYLNIAYFGNKAYGVAAAARTYFSTTPDKLTLGQAAMIAGLVKSPDAYDPVNNDPAEALGRRDYVLNAMVGTGAITEAEAEAAKAEPLGLKPTRATSNCTAVSQAHNSWGFFCDYFLSWWKEQEEFGSTPSAREDALKRGGFKVVSSMDPLVQNTAAKEATEIYGFENKRAAPIAAIEPGTGKVKALAINRHFSIEENPSGGNYPNTVNPLITGSSTAAGYQFGSTFKIFVALAALENGIPLDRGYSTKGPYISKFSGGGDPKCPSSPYWCPSNASAPYQDGWQNMWTAFGKSSNTYFVKLEETVGVAEAVDVAKRLGIQFRTEQDAKLAAKPDDWGSFTLGVSSTTPLDMANAYATLAADGRYCKPLPVQSITDTTGTASEAAAKVAQPECTQVIDKDVARAGLDIGRCPVGQKPANYSCPGGTSDEVSGIVGRPVSGKTGSSSDNATESFIGVTPQLAVAGIAVNPDNPNDFVGRDVQLEVIAAVSRLLRDSLKGQPVKQFSAPSLKISFGSGSAGSPEAPPAAPRTSESPAADG